MYHEFRVLDGDGSVTGVGIKTQKLFASRASGEKIEFATFMFIKFYYFL